MSQKRGDLEEKRGFGEGAEGGAILASGSESDGGGGVDIRRAVDGADASADASATLDLDGGGSGSVEGEQVEAGWTDPRDARSWGRNQKLFVTAVYCLSLVALGMVIGGVGPTLPGLARQTNATLSAQKFLFVARAGGYVAGSVAGGKLFDRFAGAWVLSISGLLLGISTLLSALSVRALGRHTVVPR